jgi:uncharacterized protein (TIGR02117 family)
MSKRWHRAKRWLLRGIGGVGVLAITLTIAAHTPRQWGVQPSNDCEYTIYVIGDHMHINLIVPVQTPIFDWHPILNLKPSPQPPAYLLFGWGDRIFYTETPSWDQVNFASALRALVLQNPAALLVKAERTLPETNEQLKCVRLGKQDYLALMQFLVNSFERDDRGQFIPIKGQLEQGKFFAATGKYSALRTCNSWTADGLRAANVNTPIWGGLAPAVMRQVGNGCSCTIDR